MFVVEAPGDESINRVSNSLSIKNELESRLLLYACSLSSLYSFLFQKKYN